MIVAVSIVGLSVATVQIFALLSGVSILFLPAC